MQILHHRVVFYWHGCSHFIINVKIARVLSAENVISTQTGMCWAFILQL